MAAQWHFAQQRRSDKNREPVLGEFFATDAIRNPAEALVREALQNSLDAGLKNHLGHPLEVVQIRLFLGSNSHAVPAALLMGQAVLKTHECNGTRYTPDGGFGLLDGDLVVPVEDRSLIDRFRQRFSVSREDESGLSIVIPWVDSEITRESLLQAVVRGYFYPILEGKLSVLIGVPGEEFEVNEATIVDAVKQLGTNAEAELLPLIELAEWASSRKPSEVLSLDHAPRDRPVWTPEIIPDSVVGSLQGQLDRGERIALKVPLTIRLKEQPEQESYFNVFLVNDGNEHERTVFVREGIIISDVRARRARGIRSIVVIDHKPLASLLGDSENPAHTQWQKDSSNFRGKYIYGTSYITFVTHSVSSIISILSAHQREEDTTLLKDFFSIPAPPDEATRAKERRKKKDKGKESDDPPDPPEPRKRRYRLERIPGGFRVCVGDPDAELPQLLDIRAAYEVRRGNAFKKYDPADFDLSDSAFTIMGRSVEVLEGGKNRMLAKVLERDFLLTIVGFDTQRDLRVEIQVKDREVEDAADV